MKAVKLQVQAVEGTPLQLDVFDSTVWPLNQETENLPDQLMKAK